MQNTITTFFFLLLQTFAYAQSASYIKIGANVPLQFALQYAQAVAPRLSLSAEAGILTSPFDNMIVSTLRRTNVNEAVLDLSDQMFEGGAIAGLKANYHIRRAYISGFAQYINLRGSSNKRSFAHAYLYPNALPVPALSLDMQFAQLGLQFGYSFPLGKRMELHTELACSRTVGTDANVKRRSAEAGFAVNDLVKAELRKSFRQYGYIPSVNVYLAYRIGEVQQCKTKIVCPSKYW